MSGLHAGRGILQSSRGVHRHEGRIVWQRLEGRFRMGRREPVVERICVGDFVATSSY